MVKYFYSGPEKSKKPLVIDDLTALWLMRMIVGEGGRRCSSSKARYLLVAITNRWFLWPGARYYRTFIAFMRAFSQPINPRWMTGGDLARKYIGRDAASKERLARRARICALPLTRIPLRIMRVVREFQDEGIDFLIGFGTRPSNWASLPCTHVKHPHGFDVDGDWFFEDDNLRPGVVYHTGTPPTDPGVKWLADQTLDQMHEPMSPIGMIKSAPAEPTDTLRQ